MRKTFEMIIKMRLFLIRERFLINAIKKGNFVRRNGNGWARECWRHLLKFYLRLGKRKMRMQNFCVFTKNYLGLVFKNKLGHFAS
jgi:hypothetical protein